MIETMLSNQVCQRSLGEVLGVGQHQVVLQVVDGEHDHSEPFLGGFKGLQTEIAQAEGIFQVRVIDFHRPALLVISQGLLHRQGEVGADEVLGVFIPGALFGDEGLDGFRNIL